MDGFAYGIAAGTVIAIIVVIYRWIAGLNITHSTKKQRG